MKKLTVNEMIYATLNTKNTKTPKYKEVLEALGYELVADHIYSEYNYWGIRTAEGLVLSFSKDYEGKRGLFKTGCRVHAKNFKKVDYVNLIKTNRIGRRPRELAEERELKSPRIRAYLWAKWEVSERLRYITWYRKDVDELREKLSKAENLLNEEMHNYKKALERLRKASPKSSYLPF